MKLICKYCEKKIDGYVYDEDEQNGTYICSRCSEEGIRKRISAIERLLNDWSLR